MFKSRKALVISAICLLVVFTVSIFTFFALKKDNKNDSLRDKYRLIGESEYSIDDASLPFEKRVSLAPGIAKIEVIEQLPDYTVKVEDKEVNLSSDVEFCQYRVKLISNISGVSPATDDDNTFIITFAKDFAASYPDLADGTNAICSVEAASGTHTGKYLFFDRSFYYTDSDMALAAYEGDDSPAKRICSEKELIDRIKNIRSKAGL